MKGDFSRVTFDPAKHFSRVLMQQGRVQLDADFNEQADILLHYIRTLAADLIGWSNREPDAGFQVLGTDPSGNPLERDFLIAPGHYYVDGILVENNAPPYCPGGPAPVLYSKQAGYPGYEGLVDDRRYLVYLDVWERHVTYLEDQDATGDYPSIREVALGEVDTASRAQVVWQVKATNEYWRATAGGSWQPIPQKPSNNRSWMEWVTDHWSGWTSYWQPEYGACLSVQARADLARATEPCLIDPGARYRGLENQLYRVEIHRGGERGEATFKWSRENGAVVFPVLDIAADAGAHTTVVTLGHLGRDDRLGLGEGDWVEIVDDDYVLANQAEPLLQVQAVDPIARTVELWGSAGIGYNPARHPLLRRWDHKADQAQHYGVPIELNKPLPLEDGISIRFQAADPDRPVPPFRTGDYWLIPARTETGDVEWPGTIDSPKALAPHGVHHHFAPLAIITLDDDGKVTANDLRVGLRSG